MSHFRRLRPQYCSIYDPYFWWHERFWKVPVNAKPLDGTPFRKMVWRLLGVRVFDDGCAVIAETLTTVADGCTFNAGSRLQGHSQEDGAGKADHITIGAGCALGVGSLDNYGVTMGEGAVLAPDSFLMKGDDVPPYARWGGNRAREIDGNRAAVQGGGK